MANFFLRPAAAGAAGGYNAITAAKLFWGASAILGNSTYTPDTSKIGNGTGGYAYNDIRQPFNPAGILLEAKVHEQGPGLIVRGEAQVEIYSAGGLSSIGGLGGSFSISFWGGFQIYDLSIVNIQPQGWQVTVKGMARGRSGPYNFVDLGAYAGYKGKTLGMSLNTWLQNEAGTLTEENVGAVATELTTKGTADAEGLFVEGNSLADYCESKILNQLPGTTIAEFFGFTTDGIDGATAVAAYNKFGVPGIKAQGAIRGNGTGVVSYRTFAAPNWQNQDDNLLASYICGWISLAKLVEFVNEATGKYTCAFSGTYSQIVISGGSKFCGADPMRKLCFHKGGGIGPFPINPTLYNVGTKEYNDTDVDFFKYTWFSALGGTPKNIYLSHYLIRKIVEEVSTPNAQVGEDVSYEDLALGSMPLGRFMEKVFDAIRAGTGGAIDLTLDHNATSSTTFYIVSRKVARGTVGAASIPLTARNETGFGIRDVKVSANTTKKQAARMFTNEPEVSGLGVVHQTPPAPSPPNYVDADIAKSMGMAGMFNDSSIDTIQQGVNALGLANVRSTTATVDPAALSSEISATVDLNTGLGFAQAVRISPSPALLGGSKVVWSICDVIHKVTGTDGTTEFRAVGRLTQ